MVTLPSGTSLLHQTKEEKRLKIGSYSNDLSILNDGSPTRMNLGAGNESTPDISLVVEFWKEKCNQIKCNQMGSSDHLPITITVNAQVTHQSVFGKPGIWKRNGVDWNKFTDEIEARRLNLQQ